MIDNLLYLMLPVLVAIAVAWWWLGLSIEKVVAISVISLIGSMYILTPLTLEKLQSYLYRVWSDISSIVPYADPIATVARQLDWGAVAFVVPREMSIRSIQTANLDVSPSRTQAKLDQELRSGLEDYDRLQVDTARVQLSTRMQASLSGAGFTITMTSPKIQAVLPNETTRWTWQIQPKKTGDQVLFLSLDALIYVDGKDTPYVVRSYSKKIAINVTVAEWVVHFAKNNWQWLWAVFVGPLVLLGWRHFNKKRERKRKSKTPKIWMPDHEDRD